MQALRAQALATSPLSGAARRRDAPRRGAGDGRRDAARVERVRPHRSEQRDLLEQPGGLAFHQGEHPGGHGARRPTPPRPGARRRPSRRRRPVNLMMKNGAGAARLSPGRCWRPSAASGARPRQALALGASHNAWVIRERAAGLVGPAVAAGLPQDLARRGRRRAGRPSRGAGAGPCRRAGARPPQVVGAEACDPRVRVSPGSSCTTRWRRRRMRSAISRPPTARWRWCWQRATELRRHRPGRRPRRRRRAHVRGPGEGARSTSRTKRAR